MCKNNEYDDFTKINFELIDDNEISDGGSDDDSYDLESNNESFDTKSWTDLINFGGTVEGLRSKKKTKKIKVKKPKKIKSQIILVGLGASIHFNRIIGDRRKKEFIYFLMKACIRT